METKVMSLEEAAALVKEGACLGLTGGDIMAPMAFLRHLVRAGAKNLRLVLVPEGGINADFLIGAGVVAEVESSGVHLGEEGLAPNFTRWAKAGRLKLKDSS